jgi:hypothetical protein
VRWKPSRCWLIRSSSRLILKATVSPPPKQGHFFPCVNISAGETHAWFCKVVGDWDLSKMKRASKAVTHTIHLVRQHQGQIMEFADFRCKLQSGGREWLWRHDGADQG